MALAVILDMDGLLLDTEPISLRVWRQAALECGYELDDDTCDRMIGLGQSANREMLLGRFGDIQFLNERDIPRAVATSTATALAERKLRQAGVLTHFDIVVGGDLVSRGKPDPDIFLMAASRLRHRPQDCAVLEDSAPGIRAAAAAGMRSILIPDGREPSDDMRSAAHTVVESLAAAQIVIERMMKE
jgi:HAD superfamily hydrolase (TIGR01509 family)